MESLKWSAAAARISSDEIGKAAFARIARFRVVGALRIVELLLRGIDKHGLMLELAVVKFRPRNLQRWRLHFRRHVLDQVNRLAIRSDLADLSHHQAVAVRVNEVRIDPARLRSRQLRDVEFARRKQHLAVLAVDRVAIHIGRFVEGVIRAAAPATASRCRETASSPTGGRYRAEACASTCRWSRWDPCAFRFHAFGSTGRKPRAWLRCESGCKGVRAKSRWALRRAILRWKARSTAASRLPPTTTAVAIQRRATTSPAPMISAAITTQ